MNPQTVFEINNYKFERIKYRSEKSAYCMHKNTQNYQLMIKYLRKRIESPNAFDINVLYHIIKYLIFNMQTFLGRLVSYIVFLTIICQ